MIQNVTAFVATLATVATVATVGTVMYTEYKPKDYSPALDPDLKPFDATFGNWMRDCMYGITVETVGKQGYKARFNECRSYYHGYVIPPENQWIDPPADLNKLGPTDPYPLPNLGSPTSNAPQSQSNQLQSNFTSPTDNSDTSTVDQSLWKGIPF